MVIRESDPTFGAFNDGGACRGPDEPMPGGAYKKPPGHR